MHWFAVVALISHAVYATPLQSSSSSEHDASCNVERDVTVDYQTAINEFLSKTFKSGAIEYNYHILYSPSAIWMALAGIAEGTDPTTQAQLFDILRLPNDRCERQKMYELAVTWKKPNYDVSISDTRVLVIDEHSTINQEWRNFVKRNSLIHVTTAPIKSDPKTAIAGMKNLISANIPQVDLSGNSVILDAVDFNGHWTEAFQTIEERAPFYNAVGEKIGEVDLMKTRRYFRVGYLNSLKADAVELPLGADERYRLVIALLLDLENITKIIQDIRGDAIVEMQQVMKYSTVPVEVAIPRMTIYSEINVKEILKNLGVNTLWNDSSVTRLISQPAALPSSYIQRTTITFNEAAVNPAPDFSKAGRYANTGLDSQGSQEFIANRPFIFGLYDAKTYTCILASMYTRPTYPL